MLLSHIRLALVSMAVVCLAACANQQPTHSGFLSDYTSLAPVRNSLSRSLEQKPPHDAVARYGSVYIEPVAVRIADVSPAEGRELAALTEQALREEFGKQWEIASAPGRGTIRVRTALTAVRKSNPAANVVLTAVAVPLVNGGLSAEGEFLAGYPATRIGAISWADEGRLNPLGYYSELEHPRELTRDFARAVAEELDRSVPGA